MNSPADRPPSVFRRAFLARAAGAAVGLAASRVVKAQPPGGSTIPAPLRVRVWCEGTAPREVYPDGVDGALGEFLRNQAGLAVIRARLSDPDAGLADAALDATDVLIWSGHLRHDELPADRAAAVVRRVKAGALGFVALHAACGSKPFRGLMGMACEPGGWREDGRPEHVRVSAPDHPVARGVTPFTIPHNDMFAEPFHVPEPETVVLTSVWDRGETVRSGMTWSVDRGRVVYLRSGHPGYPVLFQPPVRRLVHNAVLWAGRKA